MATFTDLGNPSNIQTWPENDYYADIDSGRRPNRRRDSPDKQQPPGGPVTIQYAGSGVWDVEGTHTYAETGSDTITVTVYDGSGNPAEPVTGTATIADVPLANATGLPVAATVGTSTGLVTVATFADPGNPLSIQTAHGGRLFRCH